VLIERQVEDESDLREVAVVAEQRGAGGHRHGCDRAVDQAARRDTGAAAGAVHAGRSGEVDDGIEPEQVEPAEQSLEISAVAVGASPGEHLHHDGLGDRHLVGLGDEGGEPAVDGVPGGSVELDPRGGVDEDQR
jgi:hypothetical protein